MVRTAYNLWRAKWGILRLLVAGFIVWVLAADTGPRLARLAMQALPDFDYAGEVRALRLEGRYGEAIMVADAALGGVGREDEESARRADVPGVSARRADVPGIDVPSPLKQVRAERELALQEEQSWVRRAKDVGLGALLGRADSMEGLVGAVTADLFIVGDIRDLVIQGTHQVVDGESDPVILTLSAVGVATTLAPEIDWVPSILKAARRAGHMSEGIAAVILKAGRTSKYEHLTAMCRDVARVAEKSSPGGAMRLLGHVSSPEELARATRFVERESPRGAFALHAAADESTAFLRTAAATGEEAARADAALAKAAAKGPSGVRLLASRAGRVMLRPHALLGLAKAIWKGNAAKLVARVVDRVDPNAWWALPAAAAWLVVEIGWLYRRVATPVRTG
ncbi:MAG: hypothetical protein WC718_10315 [Phycisphaerales bacterium]|jgi:hypothetical protein